MKRKYSLFQIRWFMSRLNCFLSYEEVEKEIRRITKGFPEDQVKMAIKDANKTHDENLKMYYQVMT